MEDKVRHPEGWSELFKRHPERLGIIDPDRILKLTPKDPNYYTPSIEDIRVGYECEYSTADGAFTYNLVDDIKKNIENQGDLIDIFEYNVIDGKLWQVRTPYLTKEQIEAEGWVLNVDSEYEKGSYRLIHSFYDGDFKWSVCTIEYNTPSNSRNLIAKFPAPSINEFRTICKLLKIN